MDAPKAKKYSFIDEVGYVPNEIIKKWAGVIGKIPKGPLPKIISSQEEFVKEFGTPSPANSFEKNFTFPLLKTSPIVWSACNQCRHRP